MLRLLRIRTGEHGVSTIVFIGFFIFLSLDLLTVVDALQASQTLLQNNIRIQKPILTSTATHISLRASSSTSGSHQSTLSDHDEIKQQQQQQEEKELFSIAPMMGHTNRHYRYFVRLFSKHTHLYTEMIPSNQIVRAFRRAKAIYNGNGVGTSNFFSRDQLLHPSEEEILEIISKIKQHPEKEYQLFGREKGNIQIQTLSELVGLSSSSLLLNEGGNNEEIINRGENPVVLQLGGKDPEILGTASAIGRAFGNYNSINLNCGCPSNAVGGRNGGAALMTNPTLVAQCVEHMNKSVHKMDEYTAATASTTTPKCTITVKHRLGVRDASTYDADSDHRKDDTEAFETCKTFVNTITLGGAVSKCHLHARLGLLGEFSPSSTVKDGKNDDSIPSSSSQTLWVPGQSNGKNGNNDSAPKRVKIDHKREQERARKRAREATIKNRYVPPLRQNVVHMLASEFPSIEFVANGGIQTLEDVQEIVNNDNKNNKVGGVAIGAMVGRAAINHPCSFASADKLWLSNTNDANNDKEQQGRPTRGEVLQQYIEYCDREEERLISYGVSKESIDNLRQRLVAVPFHLFMGEEGNDAYQRRIKKLMSKTVRIKASSVLTGAASFIPSETLHKCVDDHVPWEDIYVYEGEYRRSSAMQRVVY